MRLFPLSLLAVALLAVTTAAAGLPETGTVKFPADDPKAGVPDRFRLKEHTFDFDRKLKYDLPHAGVEVSVLTFPSPVKSPDVENNTVYAEYYRPTSATGKRPAVVVLDILDGAQVVSRAEALWLAQHDIPAVIVFMAYYGPRRPAGSKKRLLSPDVDQSVANITQTVLDCRRAAAWLADRPEVDADKLSVLGTSLGSFVGAIFAAAEPRVKAACILLGGGGLVDAFWEHPKAGLIVAALHLAGVTKDKLKAMIAPADPITYAELLKGKRLLLIGADHDDIVPPAAMKRLWEATDKPKIVWVDSTHVGAAAHMVRMMREVVKHVEG